MNKYETWNRLKEPAPVISPTGIRYWYNKYNQLHRENNLPAVIYPSGATDYYLNGEFYNPGGGPAVVDVDGTEWWYSESELFQFEEIT